MEPDRQDSVASQWSEASEFVDYDDSDAGPAADGTEPMDDAPDAPQMECLTPADLISTMLHHIEEVNTIFEISPGTARILLEHFHWDKERLLERYYDGDQDRLFAEAHVVNPNRTVQSQADPHEMVTCEICLVEYPRSVMAGLECGHVFCEDCWGSYLHSKILEQGTATIHCPALGCDIQVDELTVTRLIKNPEVLRKYQYAIAKEFVSNNKHVRWCPAPGCENAVRLAICRPVPVQCNCGLVFCFQCGESIHEPVRCEMLAQWLRKCADDSETSNWIAANTKECPKCKSIIEKNGGCNHMSCKAPHCKYEFCWVCLGPWEPHGSSWYNCNRFEEKDAKEARTAQEQSRAYLERYLFYYNRYANHDRSKLLEKKLEHMVDVKMEELQKTAHMSWIEVQFLKKALQTLSECRNTLKYTYVFAYYLKRTNECEIFESNQKDLEMATETLSGYLEGEASSASAGNLKQQVLDKTKYCHARREKILGHVADGVARGVWEYQPPEMQALMKSLPPL